MNSNAFMTGRWLFRPRVVSQTLKNLTRLKDFLRAGLAREQVVTDAHGKPLMTGSGTRRRPKTRIIAEDDEGRVIDLHAMRTTSGTRLARYGTAPQIAREIRRHSDYKTTLKHYTVLGLTDTANAMRWLPGIEAPAPVDALTTGACDTKTNDLRQIHPPQYPQQLGHDTTRNRAVGCVTAPGP